MQMVIKISIRLLIVATFLLFTEGKRSDKVYCPPETVHETKFYEFQVALSTNAAICFPSQITSSNKRLAKLVDDALAEEVNLAYSEAYMCNGQQRKLRDAASPSPVSPSSISQDIVSTDNSRRLYWGHYVYKGGARCIFCNPDYYRQRRLRCNQEDSYIQTKKFDKPEWNGGLISETIKVPKDFSKVVVTFGVLVRDDVDVDWIEFSAHDVKFKISKKDIFKKGASKARALRNGITWAYEVILRENWRRDHMDLKIAVHFPHKYFHKTGTIQINLEGKRHGSVGHMQVRQTVVLARQFCERGDQEHDKEKEELEKRLSKRLTEALEKANGREHCAHNRDLTVNVYLQEREDWNDVKSSCL